MAKCGLMMISQATFLELLVNLTQGRPLRLNGLPADWVVEALWYDYDRMAIMIRVTSPHLPDVPDGWLLPILSTRIELNDDPTKRIGP